MNYRHSYHAGNFADVLKHAIFLACLDHLALKDKPFAVIDTHAGAGVYDLSGVEAQKTAEWRDGIGRLLEAGDAPPIVARYVAAVRAAQTAGFDGMTLYPGSPRLALQILRAADRLTAIELHPPSAALLTAALQGKRNVRIMQTDGYAALARLIPPPEKRGLVLIDPPFESGDEFPRLAQAVKEAYDWWESGTILAWYPVKDANAAARFEAELQGHAIPNMLVAGLTVMSPTERMASCALVAINPPFTLFPALEAALPWLAVHLAKGQGAGSRLAWLGAPE
jgi:23S rRNA (adenine2030-N6)-methyltransferase